MQPNASTTRARATLLGMVLLVVASAAALGLADVRASSGAARTTLADHHAEAAAVAVRTMPRGDRIGQLVVTSIPGATLDLATARALRSGRYGGVIVFGENVRGAGQLASLLRAAQRAALGGDGARPRLLVSVDQEGGPVKRIPWIAPFRSAPQLGAGSSASTRAQGAATARGLRRLGIHLDLAPVADLALGPVMAGRSFGRDADRVAAHVESFVRGLHEGGGAASVKHFPGFGGADVNSDDALATVRRSVAQLRAADLEPYRRAVAAGADSVMVSHARFTGIDRLRPASASPAVYRLLRGELGYDGVAITDALHAAGFTAAVRTTVAGGCVRVIAAGADVALLTGSLADAAECRSALARAARSSAALRARIDESAERVLRLKSRLGLLPAAT